MTQRPRRRYQFRDYLSPKVLVMLALGFSSGLPFNLIGNTLGYWLRDEHTALAAIGVVSWVGITYSLKFLWRQFWTGSACLCLGAWAAAAAGCWLRRFW